MQIDKSGMRRYTRRAMLVMALCAWHATATAEPGLEPHSNRAPALSAPAAISVDVRGVSAVSADAPPAVVLARHVVATADHGGLPFAIVDKRAAQMIVYRGDGSVAGSSVTLLGQALGDHSLPGVGARTQRGELRFEDRTTPAGRFGSQPGQNLDGDRVVWLDYDIALAIHRLRPGAQHKRRAQRLASTSPRDRRVSAGCVIVPASFYDEVVQPVLGRGRGVVYVLPEDQPEHKLWQAMLERAS